MDWTTMAEMMSRADVFAAVAFFLGLDNYLLIKFKLFYFLKMKGCQRIGAFFTWKSLRMYIKI